MKANTVHSSCLIRFFFKLLFETFQMLRGNLEALIWFYIREVMNF